MLERFARSHGLDAGLVGIRTVPLTGAQIAHDPARALDSLAQACKAVVDKGARHVVLGGAALVGLAARLQPRISVPLLDNVALGAQAVADALAVATPWQAQGTVPNESVGLSPELGQLLG
jgi:Asp/Glu/hydantoin racemase